MELHKRYGSVVRIAPDHIVFSNPAYFKSVYSAGTKVKKGRWYEAPTGTPVTQDWGQLYMLVEPNVEKLRLQKRLVVPVYSNGEKHQASMDQNIRWWLRRLNTLAGQPLDMWTELELLIIDTMCEVTFAAPYGAAEAGSDNGHMRTFWSFWEWWRWIGFLPILNAIDKKYRPQGLFVIRPDPELPVFPFALGKVGEYFKAQKEGKDYPPCMLDDFHRLAIKKPEFRPKWAVKMAFTNIGAGVDTMSQNLAAVIAGVCSNGSVYDRLQAELEVAVRDGNISRGQPVPYEAAAQLAYLQACIREAVRIWPNIAIALPRIVPQDGVELDGNYISAGHTVGMNPRQLGRTEEIFGPDTDMFRPERGLQASRERHNDMKMYKLASGGK